MCHLHNVLYCIKQDFHDFSFAGVLSKCTGAIWDDVIPQYNYKSQRYMSWAPCSANGIIYKLQLQLSTAGNGVTYKLQM